MTRFPAAGHLVSWAGLCPRNDESAGKRHSTRLREGAPWLKSALVQAAWPASRKKDSGRPRGNQKRSLMNQRLKPPSAQSTSFVAAASIFQESY
jgi:transposase